MIASFELAMLAKEKGFDLPCIYAYCERGGKNKYTGKIDPIKHVLRTDGNPVEEELPPVGENITILLKGEDEFGKYIFETHTFDKITNHKRLKGWFDFYGFTHWRPIEHK